MRRDKAMERHELVQRTLVDRLKEYGYLPAQNIIYKDNEGRVVGELDVIVAATKSSVMETPRIYNAERIYEVKGYPNNNYRHAADQLRRFRDYIKNKYDKEVKLVYVSMSHGKLRARRVR